MNKIPLSMDVYSELVLVSDLTYLDKDCNRTGHLAN